MDGLFELLSMVGNDGPGVFFEVVLAGFPAQGIVDYCADPFSTSLCCWAAIASWSVSTMVGLHLSHLRVFVVFGLSVQRGIG